MNFILSTFNQRYGEESAENILLLKCIRLTLLEKKLENLCVIVAALRKD